MNLIKSNIFNLTYSLLCKYFSKKKARLILNIINNASDNDIYLFLNDNGILYTKIIKLIGEQKQ